MLRADSPHLTVPTMHQGQNSCKPVFLTRQPRCPGLVDSLEMKPLSLLQPACLAGLTLRPHPLSSMLRPCGFLPILNRTNPLSPVTPLHLLTLPKLLSQKSKLLVLTPWIHMRAFKNAAGAQAPPQTYDIRTPGVGPEQELV